MSVLSPPGAFGASTPAIQDKTKFTRQVPESIQAKLDALWKTAQSDHAAALTANPVAAIETAGNTQEVLSRHYTVADAGAKTRTDTQLIAQKDSSDYDAAVDQFLAMTGSGKSHQERMYARILAALGLTEEDLQKMPPEEREEVVAKIEEMIRTETENAIDKRMNEMAAAEAASASPFSPPDTENREE